MAKTRSQGAPETPAILTWPEVLRPNPLRQRWFERLSTLPPGLTIGAVAARLKVSYGLALFWATTFKYPFIRFKRLLKPASTGVPRWASSVDWTLPDRQLAELTGLTRQRINQVRIHAAKRPTRNSRGHELRDHLKSFDKRTTLSLNALSELAEQFEVKPRHARGLIREAGIPVERRKKVGRWTQIDWSLPNRILAEVWGKNPEAIYMARRRLNAQQPRWTRPRTEDPEYRIALKNERKRAAASAKPIKRPARQATAKAAISGSRKPPRRR